MAPKSITDWLRIRNQRAFIWSALSSVMVLAGGMIFLLLAFGPAFVAAKILVLIIVPAAHHPNAWSGAMAAAILALLFVDSLHARRDDMSIPPLWLAREYFDIGPR